MSPLGGPPELARPTRSVAIGRLDGSQGEIEQQILFEIDSEIRSTGQMGRGADPVTVDLVMETDFSGDWVNYFIAFPGFIIFAPAWNGFRYTMTYEFTATYHIPGGKLQMVEFSCGYKLNHCSFERGVVTIGIGWIVSVLSPLIAGFYYAGYHEGYTPVFLDLARKDVDDIARYATHKIYEGLNRLSSGP